MTTVRNQSLVWELVRRQHGVISHRQLVDFGFTAAGIRWRIAKGRLHPIYRGVYAVGRPELTTKGRWMAAVLRCGADAYLSHQSAAALWKIRQAPLKPIQVSLLARVVRPQAGIRAHRRPTLPREDVTTHRGIPVRAPTRTLIDLAPVLSPHQLEAAVNEADVLDLVDPETLRADLDERKGQPGVRPLRALVEKHTYRLNTSELERRFFRIVKRVGLPLPDTQKELAGRIDFHWPSLGLVVETDGWRYHRTPATQARDNRRMRQHLLAGRTAIRFSHYEIRYEERRVEETLAVLVGRLGASPAGSKAG